MKKSKMKGAKDKEERLIDIRVEINNQCTHKIRFVGKNRSKKRRKAKCVKRPTPAANAASTPRTSPAGKGQNEMI